MSTSARLVLADGSVFAGKARGAHDEVVGEVVFNTSMSGYQEILTDPSYVGQIVTFAYPHIGNVGTNRHDAESTRPHAVGLVCKELSGPANWRSEQSADAYLKSAGLPALEGVDTRRLVRHLRTNGSQLGIVSTDTALSVAALTARAREAPSMEGLDLATGVSTKRVYEFSTPTPALLPGQSRPQATAKHHVVAVDYGLKKAMLQYLVDVGCRVTVVPSISTAAQILALSPSGVFLTNGPGDPAAVVCAQQTVAALLGKVPVFGICLGHQILALALGGKTYKMKFGHRGANQPVKELKSGRVEITSQNHGFAVDAASLAGKADVSHINLNDGTVEGLTVRGLKAFSVQHHPESSPGPHDARPLFAQFAAMMG
jgi:carbamoyl-phosphate synthase small subunit